MDKPPTDSADHAEDFSHRYVEQLDIASGQVMMDLGLSNHEVGARDPDRDREHHTFSRASGAAAALPRPGRSPSTPR